MKIIVAPPCTEKRYRRNTTCGAPASFLHTEKRASKARQAGQGKARSLRGLLGLGRAGAGGRGRRQAGMGNGGGGRGAGGGGGGRGNETKREGSPRNVEKISASLGY